MPSKVFTTATRPDNEPVFFEVDGERFDCAPVAPAATILNVGLAAVGTDNVEKAKAIPTFLDGVLMPESRDRFAARMSDPERPITMETCGAVVAFLMEVYTGRPPEQPSPSE